MKPTVYLAGFISTDHPESLQWRVRVTSPLVRAGFRVLTPLRGKENLQFGGTTDGGITSTIANGRSIALRDYNDVERSSVILAHLEVFGSKRPMIGTMVELGWAWQMRKPVVAICDTKNYLMRQHPFVAEFVSAYYENEKAAVDFIKRYYAHE